MHYDAAGRSHMMKSSMIYVGHFITGMVNGESGMRRKMNPLRQNESWHKDIFHIGMTERLRIVYMNVCENKILWMKLRKLKKCVRRFASKSHIHNLDEVIWGDKITRVILLFSNQTSFYYLLIGVFSYLYSLYFNLFSVLSRICYLMI